MTFQIRVVAIADSGQEQVHDIMSLQRTELKMETLGLTLADGKAILSAIQRVVVEQQTADCVAAHRQCSDCGQPRHSKGHHDLPLRTVFGKVTIASPRLLHCDCLSGVNYYFGLATIISPDGALTHHFCYPARPVAS